MAFTPWSRCWGDLLAKVYALYANSFVRDKSVVLFQGGFVGGKGVVGIPRNSWAEYPSRPS